MKLLQKDTAMAQEAGGGATRQECRRHKENQEQACEKREMSERFGRTERNRALRPTVKQRPGNTWLEHVVV